MNSTAASVRARWWLLPALLAAGLWAGCATQKIDWSARIGVYPYDQAVIDFGPPDKWAKLQDGSIVAEWLTERGFSYVYPTIGYGYPYWAGPYYPYPPLFPLYAESYSPNYFLRLIFGPDGKLKSWKKFTR